jgi:hypothetical protein
MKTVMLYWQPMHTLMTSGFVALVLLLSHFWRDVAAAQRLEIGIRE